MPALPRPSEFELAILQVLWRRREATVREVFEELRTQRDLGYNTVLKTMLILLDKGLVVRDESSRSHVYQATLGEAETQASLVKDLLARGFAGSVSKLLTTMFNDAAFQSEVTSYIRNQGARRPAMTAVHDMRTSPRIPIASPIQLKVKGKAALVCLAVNISAGGLLVAASPSLKVGTTCTVSVAPPQGAEGQAFEALGSVVRHDAQGTAIRFETPVDPGEVDRIVHLQQASANPSLIKSYINYFKISQDPRHADSEAVLGVSGSTFRKVFLSTFSGSFVAALAPVWIFRDSLPPWTNGTKILLSFAWGCLWLGLLQPAMDLAIFHYLRRRKLKVAQA